MNINFTSHYSLGINYWNLINVLLYKPVLVLDHMYVFNCQLFHMNHKMTLNPSQKQKRERDVYAGFSPSQTLEVSVYSSLATMLKHLKASPHFYCLFVYIFLFYWRPWFSESQQRAASHRDSGESQILFIQRHQSLALKNTLKWLLLNKIATVLCLSEITIWRARKL